MNLEPDSIIIGIASFLSVLIGSFIGNQLKVHVVLRLLLTFIITVILLFFFWWLGYVIYDK
ncbi:hypothetical protein K1Y28_02690 [Staphylococcus warneri]|uniref:hypothetical protein n=1 Tax=Staphylococcus TaxID=1279 RepID=UPI0001A5CABE|nr:MULTISPECIES: hypothetical protein [Staphylococcus]MBE9428579.1 hypothetical protein [Staphylococcus epidermidis]MBY6179969.1 hypothetical protein [Staphylococcaceae bacterium DP2N0-1]AXV42472.1 hypothetical protein Ssp1_14490 [Staphylococcus sp. M0911]EEQ79886.1 hypothetical protein STAWA0001_1995 [Staphylococcus warneri L37603]MBO0377562.1 hypothetical protein [Staphylococcus warneri]